MKYYLKPIEDANWDHLEGVTVNGRAIKPGIILEVDLLEAGSNPHFFTDEKDGRRERLFQYSVHNSKDPKNAWFIPLSPLELLAMEAE